METNTNGREDRNIVIIGGGTAGFAAGIYTSRAMLEPILITGDALGGQLSLTLDLGELSRILRERGGRVYTRHARTGGTVWDRG